MGTIKINNLKIYAFHGCMEEEAKIGSEYLINISVKTELEKAGKSDHLQDTLNYASLVEIVKTEMQQRANLLENVAYRIQQKILKTFPQIKKIKTSVAKLNPPINAEAESVEVIIEGRN